MAPKREYFVGFVLSVFHDSAIKYSVRYIELEPDSGDPVGTWPHVYFFTPTEKYESLKPTYTVLISSDTADSYLRDDKSRTVFAIRYAIRAIQTNPESDEVRVSSIDYQRFMDGISLGGTDLRNRILQFYLSWYRKSPGEAIGVPDLILNFKADEQPIAQWKETLRQSKFLVPSTSSKVYEREIGFGYSTPSYVLNPEKEEEIEAFLSRQLKKDKRLESTFRIFLSYNTMDKETAGKIADFLQEAYRVEVFLAHEKLKVSEEWRERILEEIDKCDVLLALVSKNFKRSKWTDQEVGIAIGKDKAIVPIYNLKRLYGFLDKFQGKDLTTDLRSVLDKIASDLGFAKRPQA